MPELERKPTRFGRTVRSRRVQLAIATTLLIAGGISAALVSRGKAPVRPSAAATLPPPSVLPSIPGATPWPTPDTSRCKKPTGILADGRSDVTAALQRFLDAIPTRGCAVLPGPAAHYRVDGGLQLIDRTHIAIYGNGATLMTPVPGQLGTGAKGRGRSTRSIIQALRGGDIQIWDLMIDGPNPQAKFDAPYEEESGVRLTGVQGATIRNVSVRAVFGDAVSLYGFKSGGTSTPTRNVTVSALDAEHIGRQGVAFVGVDGAIVEDSHFDVITHSVFDLEPLPNQSAENIRILRNSVGQYGNTFVGGGGRGLKTNVYVGYNQSSGSMRIKFYNVTHWTIEHNVSLTAAKIAFINGSGDDLRIIANTQPFAEPGVACPPNCGPPALDLSTDSHGSVCHAVAADNSFAGAQLLFQGTIPRGCSWVDGGHNVIGGSQGQAPSTSKN